MDTLLLIVTVLSLAAAFVSVMAVKKLKHLDQQRADARVEALSAAAMADDLPIHVEPKPLRPQPTLARTAPASTQGTWKSVAGELQWDPEPYSPAPSSQLPAASQSIDERAGDLFGTVRREPETSGRFALAAGLALIVALGGAAVVFTTSGRERASAPAERQARANPLELVSLGHTHDDSSLTISGVVRNPSNGPKLEGLTAVVSLIDDHGGLISTKDVPLDYRALGPGEEAPFKVTVPDPGSIARYRVSFRAGTDVVPHVDRRTDAKLASTL